MTGIMLSVISIILIGSAIDIVAYSIGSANASSHEVLPSSSSTITDAATESNEAEPNYKEIFDAYESACNNSDANFERSKMEEEVKLCYNLRNQELDQALAQITMADKLDLLVTYYKVKSGGRLAQSRADAVKKLIMEPGCRFMSGAHDCLKPLNDQVMKQCGQDGIDTVIVIDYIEEMVAASCHNGGSRVVEFLGNGGLECLKFYSELDDGSKCIQDSLQILAGTYSGDVNTTIDACEILDIFNGCLTTIIDGCPNQGAENPLKAAIAELVTWTSETCSHAAAKQNRFTFTNTIEL